MERRCTAAEPMKVEARAEGEEILSGYAAIYNTPTDIGGWWEETIAAGAFDRCIADGQDVRALFDHDTGKILARSGNGTLTLRSDERGLFDEIKPNLAVGFARDVLETVRRGDLYGQSFMFTVLSEQWIFPEEGLDKRIILEVETLYDVGPVTFPAYEATSISARDALAHRRNEIREFRSSLRSTFGTEVPSVVLSPAAPEGATVRVAEYRGLPAYMVRREAFREVLEKQKLLLPENLRSIAVLRRKLKLASTY